MRVCKPNPQVLLQASQKPVVHKYAVQFEGNRDNPGLPTAPLSTPVGGAAADAVGTGDGGDDISSRGGDVVVNRSGDDGAERFEDGRVGGIGVGGVVGAEIGGAGGGGGLWHKLHVCLQLALREHEGHVSLSRISRRVSQHAVL